MVTETKRRQKSTQTNPHLHQLPNPTTFQASAQSPPLTHSVTLTLHLPLQVELFFFFLFLQVQRDQLLPPHSYLFCAFKYIAVTMPLLVFAMMLMLPATPEANYGWRPQPYRSSIQDMTDPETCPCPSPHTRL